MASATLNYSFPYPLNTDTVDIAGDIQALAEAIDLEIKEINQDSAAEMITNGTHTNGLSVSYNDASNTLNFSLAQNIQTSASPDFANVSINGDEVATKNYVTSNINALDTDDIEEGSTNLYFTNQRAIDAASATYLTETSASSTYALINSPALTGIPTAPTAAADTNTTQIATTAYVIGQAYAKLASPALTGTPTAPTAVADTNTTQIATTAYVIGQAASTNPVALGTVLLGSSNRYARADHRHPTTGLGLTSGTLAQFSSTTSSQLAGVISDETGSGALVFGTGPTLSQPVVDNPRLGYTTTVTAGTITTLTSTSSMQQFFTGTSNHILNLPVTSTLALGQSYIVHNNSTGEIAVRSSGSFTIYLVPAGVTAQFTCILTSGTTAASWNYDITGNNAISGTGSLVLTDSSALTGIPTAPTASVNTNTTQIATTAFVQTAVTSASSSLITYADALDTDDIEEGAINKYYTDERVDDRVSNLIIAGGNLDSSYNDASGTFTLSLSDTVSITNDLSVGTNINVSGSAQFGGDILPDTDSIYDIGSATNRFASLYLSSSSIYLGDLSINNKSYTNASSQVVESIAFTDLTIDNSPEVNEVDGTSGVWSLQAGSGSVYLINRLDNKKYAITMTEII